MGTRRGIWWNIWRGFGRVHWSMLLVQVGLLAVGKAANPAQVSERGVTPCVWYGLAGL
jgi:hypothetical protein